MTDRKPLELQRSRSQAEIVIDRHLEEGRKLLDSAQGVSTEAEYREWRETWERWVNLSVEGLMSIYNGSGPAEEFRNTSLTPAIVGGAVDQEFEWEREAVERGINTLASLRERLEYVEAPGDSPELALDNETPAGEEQIFIVHGHSDEVKEAVSRVLEKTGGHEVVILHEQPNQGRTLIEKFEDHARASDHAIVLLTGDDVGGEAPSDGSAPPLNLRGRQNVVFELGFFVGRLGRSRVVVLYEKGVELPSDFKGVAYIPLNDESWRYKLLQELRSAGLDFDLNKIPA